MSRPKPTLIPPNEQEALEWLLRFSPQVVLDSTYESLVEQNTGVTMASTRTNLYTLAELEKLKEDNNLTEMQWRQIGDNQKALYRERLLKRVGQAPLASFFVPAFRFNDGDWQNIFQLEALVEFYMNFNDPWQAGLFRVPGVNVPGTPENLLTLYQTIDLLRGWHLVLIDSFGGRLSGSRATVAGNVIALDSLPNPSKINPNFDTIYVPNDLARPSQTYRITAVDDTRQTVTLDGQPRFQGGSSAWHIPAGVSGQLPPMNYNLGPGGPRGFDHLDGALFIIKDGRVHQKFRWNSYTSRDNPPGSQELSSLRGNKEYEFSSFRSTNAFRNYSFAVRDRGAAYDGVREARFYFDTPVTADVAPLGANPNGGGKTLIRIHHSVTNNSTGGASSDGCIVSGDFYAFRDAMISLYQEDYARTHGGARSAPMDGLRGANRATSETIWNRTAGNIHTPGPTMTAGEWNNHIRGILWLVRPDERPLG